MEGAAMDHPESLVTPASPNAKATSQKPPSPPPTPKPAVDPKPTNVKPALVRPKERKEPKEPKEPKQQPTKRLPTDRIRFKAQLDIIRAYGNASQSGARAVNYREAAKQVRLDPDTLTLLSAFLVENGFCEKAGNDLMPSKPVIDFALAHTWAAETAPRKLAPLIKRTWFGQSLCTMLGFRPYSEDEAVAELAHEISAGPEFKARISILVEYVEAVGLLRRDGGQLMLAEPIADAPTPRPESASASPSPGQPMEVGRSGSSTMTGFMSAEGAVQFHVSIRVTMAEMSGWAPDRIAAFFAGLAQVLAAKKGNERVG
jgi:hypothetical protein